MSAKDERAYKDPNKLVSAYKKRGFFDQTRKELFEEFKNSEQYQKFQADLKEFIRSTVTRDPNILNKNRVQMAALLQTQFLSRSNMSANIESFLQTKYRGIDNELLKKMTKDLNHEFTEVYVIDPEQGQHRVPT